MHRRCRHAEVAIDHAGLSSCDPMADGTDPAELLDSDVDEFARILALISGDRPPWIPERSATRLREVDLHILSKLGKQGLEWRLEPEAFTGGEVGGDDDLLDFPVGCLVDIEVARQPSA